MFCFAAPHVRADPLETVRADAPEAAGNALLQDLNQTIG
jgi:hypothetical protein